MTFATAAASLAERYTLPDFVIRAGMRRVIAANDAYMPPPGTDAEFARSMAAKPIAEHAGAANRQHYELPPEFFALFLGPARKYSSCLYPTGHESLAEAEVLALAETVAHAGLQDGQDILELGCGWGSLSLTMAEKFPRRAHHLGFQFRPPTSVYPSPGAGARPDQSQRHHRRHE